jgi:hypothetical protein
VRLPQGKAFSADIGPRRLELRQALYCDRWPADVSAQPFKLLTFIRSRRHAAPIFIERLSISWS